jgi:hypothetical protein
MTPGIETNISEILSRCKAKTGFMQHYVDHLSCTGGPIGVAISQKPALAKLHHRRGFAPEHTF